MQLRRKPIAPSVLKLGGAALVGLAAAAVLAAPAHAWDAPISGTPVCDKATGTVTVTWSIDNSGESSPVNVTVKSHSPSGSTVTLEKKQIPAKTKASGVAIQTNVPANTAASLTLHLEWVNNSGAVLDKKDKTGNSVATPCVKTSPSPSAGGGGGGGGSPTPSAPPALPVTGSNTAVYAGSAVALLGVGSVLFVVARRRRIRFDA